MKLNLPAELQPGRSRKKVVKNINIFWIEPGKVIPGGGWRFKFYMAKDKQIVKMRVPKNQSPTGIRELDISSLDRKPISDYYRMAGKFVNVENHVYYDTGVFAAAVINQEHVAELFTKGSTQAGNVVNNGAAIARKGEFLTNMVTDGEFDNSTSFLLEMISVDILLTSEPATTVTNGAIIAPAHNTIATYSAANHFKAISRQFKLSFRRSEQVMVSGLLYEFPSPFVASGSFGASLGGFVQNGFSVPSWNKLSEIHALQSNDRFSVDITPVVSGFVPQVPFEIRVLFIGKRIQTLFA